jgi:hypothetical protein
MKKLNKSELVNEVRGYMNSVSKEVKDWASYIVKAYDENPRNVTMEDIKETLVSIKELVSPQEALLPMENSLKPKKNVKKESNKSVDDVLGEIEDSIDAEEEAKHDSESEVAVDKEEKVKKLTPKKPKTEEKPKTESKKKEPIVKTTEAKVVSFPDEYESKTGKLVARRDITSIQQLKEEFEEKQGDLVVCAYWTARDLRQYEYDPMRVNPKPVKSFADDLDIQLITYVGETGTMFTTVSLYTEVPFIFTPVGFETDEDGLRYMNGVEYQIYEVVEDVE